ncbi:RNA polymerase sigma-70 factor (ECF subfamily) [Ancylomarina subtilis]|uniref:RNA polymerase sigma-70 factor (ECF subfamily) n=1 Tax=Ancylomarina subtilis TaxID=1639035 RepID=A0A4Q7VK39_9BACT|nr:RNA polymerase sigma-70 factor [Ancylomarina subtilis]RZT96437.1 RNA polymerase sigma-70 factor (ECF subfamily) [Ancylomarina subtilis]
MVQQVGTIDIRKTDFRGIFNKYFPSLCIFANRFVNDEDLSKDMVQEVFLKIWNSATEFESEKSLKVYLYLATKNTCFDYLKKEKRKKQNGHLHTDGLRDDALWDDDSVVLDIIREETYRQLEDAITLLPDKAREVVLLNLKSLSNRDIADELNISINTVKTHKLTAFKKLREILGHQFVVFLLIDFYQFFE